MDTSTMSSMRKAVLSYHETTLLEHEVPDEESTWTMYFQDFYKNNNNRQESEDCFCNYDNPSLISDAASSVGAKKIARKRGKSLTSSKKRRTTEGTPSVGNDLEDTASSPSASPKGCSMTDELDNNTTQEETREITQTETRLNGEDGDLTGLKKKGLCLVPLSMLSHYIA